MAKHAFKPGDLVVLKSGGPPMTIDTIPGDGNYGPGKDSYHCKWFKGASKESGYFGEHLLQAYVAPAKK